MTRELARLEVDLTSVDINCGYATHSKLRNKSQIPDAGKKKKNNLLSTQTSNKTHGDGADTSSNLYSPLRDSWESITLSDASQNSTRM